MFLYFVVHFIFIGSYLHVVQAVGYRNEFGKPVVVLAAPSVWDSYYKDIFLDLINFDIDLARAILPTDNVVVVADKQTMPYLQGRSHRLLKKLPNDILLEANIYDVFLRDFAPMGLKETMKFHYSPKSMDGTAAAEIDKSMMRFLAHNSFKWSKNSTMILSGAQVVDNGVDKAVVDKSVYEDNKRDWQEWALTIQLMSTFKNVALVEWINNTGPLGDNVTSRLDDWMAWLDDDILAVSAMTPENHDQFVKSLKKSFKSDVKIVEVPDLFQAEFWNNHTGVCGLYTPLLKTDEFIYVPVYGNDPDNWLMGHSTMVDKMVVELIQVNAKRTVVPVNMPRRICKLGASLRSLTWVAHGDMADKLIKMARHQSAQNSAADVSNFAA